MLTAKNQVFKPFFNIYSKMQKEKVNIRDQEAMGSSPVTPTSLNVHNATEHSYVKE